MRGEEGLPEHHDISHRRVDRDYGRIITDIPEATLLARGYEYVAEKFDLDDDSIERMQQSVSYEQKKNEYELSAGAIKKSRRAFLLRDRINHLRAWGYDVRLIHVSGTPYYRIFKRFDLDRFITRTPREAMAAEQYSMQTKKFRYHVWGEGLEHCTEQQREGYKKENDEIEQYVESLSQQNFQVVFIEETNDNEHILTPYTRPKKRIDNRPLEVHRPLTGITDESPEFLLRQGFKYTVSLPDDGSLDFDAETPFEEQREPAAKKIRPLALDTTYLTLLEYIEKQGLPSRGIKTKKPNTIREHILDGLKRGFEIRAVPVTAHDKHRGDIKRFSLYERFDLARFIAPPNVRPEDLLVKGFTFQENFALSKWGDVPEAKERPLPLAAQREQKKLENFILDKENDGYRIKCIPGKYIKETGFLSISQGALAVFSQPKP